MKKNNSGAEQPEGNATADIEKETSESAATSESTEISESAEPSAPRDTAIFETVPVTSQTISVDLPEQAEPEAPRELTEEEKNRREISEAEEETRTMIGLEDDFGFNDVPRKHKTRRKKHPLRTLLMIVLFGGLLMAFLLSPIFRITETSVEGNHYYSDQEITEMANVATGENIFLHANRSEIRKRLLDNPYFTEVKVSRKLPHTLKITVSERTQVAEIRYGREYVVIDAEGVVLRKTEVDPKLTILSGLTLSKIQTGEQVAAEEKSTLKVMLSMISSMEKGDFYFKRITISGSDVHANITNKLSVKGTAKLLKSVVDSGALQKVVNKLLTSGIRRGTITIGDTSYLSFSPVVS